MTDVQSRWRWRFVDGTAPLPPGAVVIDDPVVVRCQLRQYEEWARQLALPDGDLAWEIFVDRPPRNHWQLNHPFNGQLPEGWREKLRAMRQGLEEWIAARGPTAERRTLIREPYGPPARPPERVPIPNCRNALHADCPGGREGCERADV